MLKIAFIPMSFLHFFAVFYKRYSDLQQIVFQCKKYSESTAGNGTQRKTVIFAADIFTVYATVFLEHNDSVGRGTTVPIISIGCVCVYKMKSF